jgi:hypothetical protein
VNNAQGLLLIKRHLSFFPIDSMVEYADIVWYQSGALSYEDERLQVEKKYGERMDTNGKPELGVIFLPLTIISLRLIELSFS